jgi:hypothetical protein
MFTAATNLRQIARFSAILAAILAARCRFAIATRMRALVALFLVSHLNSPYLCVKRKSARRKLISSYARPHATQNQVKLGRRAPATLSSCEFHGAARTTILMRSVPTLISNGLPS